MNTIEDYKLECSPDTILSDRQEIIVEIIYWLRNKKKNIKWCLENNIIPGPSGIINKRGIWFPNTSEACDSTVESYKLEEKTGKWIVDPYAWSKHCKTKPHIRYLINHRKKYLEYKLSYSRLEKLADIIYSKGLILTHCDLPFFNEFKTDILSARYPEINLETMIPNLMDFINE